MLGEASTLTLLRQQPVRLDTYVAQFEKSPMPFGHWLKTVWTVIPEKTNMIRVQSEGCPELPRTVYLG